MLDLIIKNGLSYIDGKLQKHDIGINNNKISEIGSLSNENSKEVIDARNLIVLPGCIDTQVHFREPGSTDAEDLNSGSRAAIAGGITSVFEMPNTNPPTSSKKEFSNKLKLAKKFPPTTGSHLLRGGRLNTGQFFPIPVLLTHFTTFLPLF